jgi:hypothetical protein
VGANEAFPFQDPYIWYTCWDPNDRTRNMKPSTELHDLIKSLTKSEKRFFKLHSSLQSGDKNYLRIFDAIDKQKVYDEDAIKKYSRRRPSSNTCHRRRTTCTN